jgi:hypothetical protein
VPESDATRIGKLKSKKLKSKKGEADVYFQFQIADFQFSKQARTEWTVREPNSFASRR